MSAIPASSEATAYDDSHNRDRIGPWREEGLAPLDHFDPDTNFVVRAAAGSGKTTALVARMVALIRSGVPVEDLTAITFTRKAAGEMNARLFEELREARRHLSDKPQQKRRVGRALANVQSAFVGTIHSFCSRLLRERPLAAGLPPDFSAGLGDREERRLRERAWRTHLRETYQTESGRQKIGALAEMGVDPQDLPSFFDTLCTHSELDPLVDPEAEVPDLGPVVQKTTRKLKEWNERRPKALPKGRDAAMKKIDKALRMRRLRDLDSPLKKVEFLEVVAGIKPGSGGDVKNTYWRGGEIDSKAWAKELRDERLEAFQASVLRPALREWQAYVHRAVTEFTRPAVERYRQMRREEGLLTFHDLLSHARDLLRDRPQIRRAIQRRYPRLLVDEFQDTDPVQAEILSYLSSQDPSEEDWTECHPRDGSLFIVGDDKQSIYRFRRADKDVFDAFRRRVDEEPNGEAVDLTKNFRSRAPICEWCNSAFSDIFGAEEHRDIQADYVPFQPERPAGPAGTAIRRKPVGGVRGNWGRKIAEKDAAEIARFIRSATRGEAHPDFYRDEEGAVFPDGASPSDFLILTWRKKRLGIYADALAKRGIPHTVTGSEDLGDSDELKALVDLLRAALRPDDPIAAVAYLKGGLAGCSDDDLYRFRQAGGRLDQMSEPIADSTARELPGAVEERLRGAARRLRATRQVLAEARPGAGLRRIVERLGLLAGGAHPRKPSEASLRAGAVLRILSYVQHLGAEGLSWDEVTEELDLVLQGDETLDGMTLETGRGDAVRIMNVHQAKGLEAPVVFLADPYARGSEPDTTVHLRRGEEEIVAPIVQGESYYQSVTHAPRGWHEGSEPGYKAEEKRHEAAEDRRLLYVAATRAERLLVVSTYPKKEASGYWSPLYPHLREADVSELQVPEGEDKATGGAAPAPGLEAARRERQARLEAGRKATYVVQAVTGEETALPGSALPEGTSPSEEDASLSGETGPSESPGPPREEGAPPAEGHGQEFGTAVHKLFELMIRHRDDPPAVTEDGVRSVLESAGADVSEEAISTATEMVGRLVSSDLWGELQGASEVLVEHPFARHTLAEAPDEVETEGTAPEATASEETGLGETLPDGKPAGAKTGPEKSSEPERQELITRGTIDLAYRSGGEWSVVDFKTDRVGGGSGEDLDIGHRLEASHPYRRQVRAYARAWADLTGEMPSRAGLWFASAGQLVPVDAPAPSS